MWMYDVSNRELHALVVQFVEKWWLQVKYEKVDRSRDASGLRQKKRKKMGSGLKQ